MSNLAFSELTERVRGLLQNSPLKDDVRGISVEQSDWEDDTVQVIISLGNIEAVQTRDASKVIHLIWDVMSEVDDRFFSVNFAEAA